MFHWLHGNWLYRSKQYVKAIAAYDEAAKIRRELKLDRDLSITLTHLGNAYLS